MISTMQANPWIICPQARPSARIRLFCFSYAGVGASAFRGWTGHLPSAIDVCFVQLPGRENRLRERPYTCMDDLIPSLATNMLPMLDRPYAFYGHSLGAFVAFETARQLRRSRNTHLRHFFAGASPAPQLSWEHSFLHPLNDKNFLDEIQSRYGGVPQQILDDPEIRALLLPVMRADVTMLENYQYTSEPPLQCGVTVFGGQNDRMVMPHSLEAWRHQTEANFRVEMLESGHLFTQPVPLGLLRSIAADLAVW